MDRGAMPVRRPLDRMPKLRLDSSQINRHASSPRTGRQPGSSRHNRASPCGGVCGLPVLSGWREDTSGPHEAEAQHPDDLVLDVAQATEIEQSPEIMGVSDTAMALMW
jgi:hypothetical protein